MTAMLSQIAGGGRRRMVPVLVGLALVGVIAAGIGLLHVRAGASIAAEEPPTIAVAVRSARMEDGYTIIERFAGRLEPGRQTRLAFERGGLVTDVLVEEGDRVAEGAPVARLDTAKLAAERARLLAQRKELEARQALARATLDRQRALKTGGWQTEQRYDEARFGLAELSAALARLDASIASIDVDLAKSALAAPYAGRVAARFIDEGAVVDTGAPVIELLEADARQVRVGVSVDAARSLRIGNAYRLNAGGRELRGRLVSRRPDLQTGTRTVTVLLEVIGGGEVPFGEVVELLLEHRTEAEGTWLPIAALSEGRAFVRGTVADGARVVANGTNRIIPGQPVVVADQAVARTRPDAKTLNRATP